jgi:lysophospholipase L1-like esterase
VVVFHDDNSDGTYVLAEGSRVPDVRVQIAGHVAKTAAGGRAMVDGVPAGDQELQILPDSLPPFFQAGPAARVTVPTSDDVYVGLTLPVGNNNLRTYLAYGDSVTLGIGSTDGLGYRGKLQAKLADHFGDAVIVNAGRDANATERGLRLIDGTLEHVRPAYIIIMMGTNDWHESNCQNDPANCPIVPNLRGMVRKTKEHQTLPVVCTIPAINPAVNDGRNAWAESVNAEIRAMAAQEGGVLIADVYAAMKRRNDLSQLYADNHDVHPNDAGYDVIADAIFEAIAHGRLE